MGCFSPAEIQRSAANVCAHIASCSPGACEVLLRADVGSMIEQHIKKSDTTLYMFEDALHVVAAIARHPGLVSSYPITSCVMKILRLLCHQHISVFADCQGIRAPQADALLCRNPYRRVKCCCSSSQCCTDCNHSPLYIMACCSRRFLPLRGCIHRPSHVVTTRAGSARSLHICRAAFRSCGRKRRVPRNHERKWCNGNRGFGSGGEVL